MSESSNHPTVTETLPPSAEMDTITAYSRDPQYYFEDGSIVLLVKDVVFKVHKSLIKAESQVFDDMFAMPGGDSSGEEGMSDQHPVVVPQVEPAQFRNLMKMFYCPPSSRFYISLQSDDPTSTGSWDNFKFYLDVARLSHRFTMVNMEEWAKSQLKHLVSSQGEGFVSRSQWGCPAALVLLDAIEYSQIIGDIWLANDLKNILGYYLGKSEWTSRSELLELFRIPDLRTKYPSLFGLLFNSLLRSGRGAWGGAEFTKMDRTALYSAMVDLTPLPESFKLSIRSPLFSKPGDLEAFRKHFVPDPLNPVLPGPCGKGCDQALMDIWFQEFSDTYYKSIASDRIGGPTTWLPLLYKRRLNWAKKVRQKLQHGKCGDCYVRYIDQLDRDLEVLFSRMGEYYREIE